MGLSKASRRIYIKKLGIRKMMKGRYFLYLLRHSFKLFCSSHNLLKDLKLYKNKHKVDLNSIKYFARLISLRKTLLNKLLLSGVSYHIIRSRLFRRHYRKKLYLNNSFR
jgi:hypothetical protein